MKFPERDWSDESDKTGFYKITNVSPEEAANTLICLVNQASYLLRRQMQGLEEKFLQEGGFTERMNSQRQARRGKS